MRVHVHPARRHHEPARVDLLPVPRQPLVDGRDASAANAEIGHHRVGGGGHEPPAYHQVVGHPAQPLAVGRKRFLAIMPCTPWRWSTTWVTPKSPATEISE